VSLRSAANRALRIWASVELGAGIVALAILVAALPLVLVLWSAPAQPWFAMGAVLPVSIPLAVLLARAGMRLPRELATA
jgi:hypothetical protein